MALRTAPCPSCSSTIVFGERKCRKCQMVFDYGASPPPEPTQAEVFDALLSSGAQAQASAPPRTPAPSSAPPSSAPPQAATMDGLDTGRFSAGDVEVEDIPGFIDSSLFKAMTPDHVDVQAVPGLEITRTEVGEVRAIAAVDVDSGRVSVGEVAPVAGVPGLYGSDMFKTDVDIAAGGDQSPMLETSTLKVKARAPAASSSKQKKLADDDLPRIVCNNCGSTHQKPRCPSCATAHPLAQS